MGDFFKFCGFPTIPYFYSTIFNYNIFSQRLRHICWPEICMSSYNLIHSIWVRVAVFLIWWLWSLIFFLNLRHTHIILKISVAVHFCQAWNQMSFQHHYTQRNHLFVPASSFYTYSIILQGFSNYKKHKNLIESTNTLYLKPIFIFYRKSTKMCCVPIFKVRWKIEKKPKQMKNLKKKKVCWII